MPLNMIRALPELRSTGHEVTGSGRSVAGTTSRGRGDAPGDPRLATPTRGQRDVTTSPPPPSASAHPAAWRFGFPIYHAETRQQWRSWLEHHHASSRGVWLCSWRSGTERPRCPYPDIVEEALCFGW